MNNNNILFFIFLVIVLTSSKCFLLGKVGTHSSISLRFKSSVNKCQSKLVLPMTVAEGANISVAPKVGPTLTKLNIFVARCSWVSWWIQIVLSVISSVILLFANAVRNGTQTQIVSSGFFLSSLGVIVSFINCFTTWNFTRLNRRIMQNKLAPSSIIDTFRKYCKISITVSLVGMFFALLGAEQIVGTLASKVLSTQSVLFPATGMIAQPGNALQALDIFLVQANTNCLVSHFSPMAIYTWLESQLPKNELLVEDISTI